MSFGVFLFSIDQGSDLRCDTRESVTKPRKSLDYRQYDHDMVNSTAKRRLLSRFLVSLAAVAAVLALAITVQSSSSESVRSDLIKMQRTTGLTLISERDNKIYTVDFAKHKLGQPKSIPSTGTAVEGNFSEDGTRIAFKLCRDPGITHPTPYSTDCPNGIVLAIMRGDGSATREYPEFANPGYMMCWSHDGSKIALVVQDRRKERYAPDALQILDLATEETQIITEYDDAFVEPQCWSPDDRQVVYTANNTVGTEKVAVYDVETKTSRDFSKGNRPTWSPDGNWIALMDCPPSLSGCKYYAVRPSGKERKLLFTSEDATSLWWSPDSRYVAYVNGAGALERWPSQLLREMVRLRVRRLEDNSVDSFADFLDGDTMNFQWVKSDEVGRAASQPPAQ
jgi:dipeptidyl aminopeptidase/acylaminoacyl peptidase